jgi:hypothetical protein
MSLKVAAGQLPVPYRHVVQWPKLLRNLVSPYQKLIFLALRLKAHNLLQRHDFFECKNKIRLIQSLCVSKHILTPILKITPQITLEKTEELSRVGMKPNAYEASALVEYIVNQAGIQLSEEQARLWNILPWITSNLLFSVASAPAPVLHN